MNEGKTLLEMLGNSDESDNGAKDDNEKRMEQERQMGTESLKTDHRNTVRSSTFIK